MTEAAAAPVAAPEAMRREPVNTWKRELAPFARPDIGASVLDLLTSVVPYLALTVAMYLMLDAGVPYLIVLGFALPAAGCLLRTYIVFHDCSHGSFLPTKRANVWLGNLLGLVVYSSFAAWRHEHAVHHATAGDLDRRGVGDVPTLTVDEYRAMGFWGRTGYFLFRNPVIMFGLGWIWALLIQPRTAGAHKRSRIRRSVHLINAALVLLVGGVIWLVGWKEFLLVQVPPAFVAGAWGVFLFYVQHQFEDVYWETSERWTYADAALRGSSHLKLPKLLQFFTGNIGLHHVHHLNARIPNYNLQAAHESNPIFEDVPTLTFWDGVKASRLKLWDPESRRLITWREYRRVARTATSTQPVSNLT